MSLSRSTLPAQCNPGKRRTHSPRLVPDRVDRDPAPRPGRAAAATQPDVARRGRPSAACRRQACGRTPPRRGRAASDHRPSANRNPNRSPATASMPVAQPRPPVKPGETTRRSLVDLAPTGRAHACSTAAVPVPPLASSHTSEPSSETATWTTFGAGHRERPADRLPRAALVGAARRIDGRVVRPRPPRSARPSPRRAERSPAGRDGWPGVGTPSTSTGGGQSPPSGHPTLAPRVTSDGFGAPSPPLVNVRPVSVDRYQPSGTDGQHHRLARRPRASCNLLDPVERQPALQPAVPAVERDEQGAAARRSRSRANSAYPVEASKKSIDTGRRPSATCRSLCRSDDPARLGRVGRGAGAAAWSGVGTPLAAAARRTRRRRRRARGDGRDRATAGAPYRPADTTPLCGRPATAGTRSQSLW